MEIKFIHFILVMLDSAFFTDMEPTLLTPDDSDRDWLLATIRSLCHDASKDWRFDEIRSELESRGFITRSPPVTRVGSPFPQVYKSLGEIGEGGYGKVYKIHNLIDKQQYALKVVDIEKHEVGSAMKEVQCLAAVNSPRILRYYSSWLEEDSEDQMSLFIQTELVSGQTLREFIEMRREIDIPFTKHIMKELTLALCDIHSCGIIHRDFNPSNVILNSDGNIKVIDFGISSMQTDPQEDESDESMYPLSCSAPERPLMSPLDQFCLSAIAKANTWREVGTPMYSSPRQLGGTPADSSDDIYSFGIMIMEVFSMFKTSMEKVKVISELRKGHIPPDFSGKWPRIAELVKKMTASDPAERPSAWEILESGVFDNENL